MYSRPYGIVLIEHCKPGYLKGNAVVMHIFSFTCCLCLHAGPSILIFLSGSAILRCGSSSDLAGKGFTIFLPAGSPEVRLEPQSQDQDLLLFQAYCDPQSDTQ